MHWKEDITDEFPGKGKALFQVIQKQKQFHTAVIFVFNLCISRKIQDHLDCVK